MSGGGLGADVELVGCDLNAALIGEARRLAAIEGLDCTFLVADALHRAQAATVIVSAGLLHHFRGDALRAFFAQHDPTTVRAFVHHDLTPSHPAIRFAGAWMFHLARMRIGVSRHDGVVSAMRAHDDATLAAAATRGAPWADVAVFEPAGCGTVLTNVMRPVVGLAPDLAAGVTARLGRRSARLVPAEAFAMDVR